MSARPVHGKEMGDPYSWQLPWGCTASDSLQYELFFDGRFVSIRALKFPSSTFTYAWLYDGGGVRTLFSSHQPLHSTAADGLITNNEHLSFEFGASGGQIRVEDAVVGPHQFEIAETRAALWRFPPDDVVIHQPLLQVTWTHGSETLTGMGYCKRYTCGAENEHMYWRFITGPLRGNTEWFWTAEAAFNLRKYDYFKIARADGTIVTADQPGSWHRDRMAHGAIDGAGHTVSIEDLGRVEFEIREGPVNMKISQAFCRACLVSGDEAHDTFALNEIACGIHG